MVLIKLVVILFVIIAGAFHVNPGNWDDFIPNGFSGVMSGVSAVFFAYIGFDAISTTAEECKNPQRDLPRAMFYTLIICTSLYIVLTLVLTGMTNYSKLDVADPLAFVFQNQGSRAGNWIAGIVSVSAIFVIASVLLVYQLGQPRIWMSMSRDGLLPKVFSRIHPKYKTPSFSTILTGLVVGIPALFMNLDVVIALTSIGTLFAFVLVCGGVLLLQRQKNRPESKFRVPFISGRVWVPVMLVIALVVATVIDRTFLYGSVSVLSNRSDKSVELINNTSYPIEHIGISYQSLKDGIWKTESREFNNFMPADTIRMENIVTDSLGKSSITDHSIISKAYEREIPGLHYFKNLFTPESFPMTLFWILFIVITVLSVRYSLSLIPVLGLLSCFYLMAQESHTNWLRFLIWLVIGLVIYFTYGYKNSRLARDSRT